MPPISSVRPRRRSGRDSNVVDRHAVPFDAIMSATCRTFITAEMLAERLGERCLRVFDCRFDLARPDAGREQYASGHLPGARYADLNRDLSAPITPASGRHPLPSPEVFAATLRAWGVDRDSHVVAYDDGNGAYAARLWWLLRWLGHEQTCVLDGGYARWTRLGLPVTAVEPPLPAVGNFTPRIETAMTADAARVLDSARATMGLVLDARSPDRFRGDVEPIDTVAGHVPGARNLPFAATVASDGTTLPPDALRARLVPGLGGAAPEHAIAMCGSGVTACRLLLAFEHAGLAGAKLYPGSWSEWIRDPDRPIARGSD
jgi:thiosulfate/3-mercaptopyruvate sulfurtransferase